MFDSMFDTAQSWGMCLPVFDSMALWHLQRSALNTVNTGGCSTLEFFGRRCSCMHNCKWIPVIYCCVWKKRLNYSNVRSVPRPATETPVLDSIAMVNNGAYIWRCSTVRYGTANVRQYGTSQCWCLRLAVFDSTMPPVFDSMAVLNTRACVCHCSTVW